VLPLPLLSQPPGKSRQCPEPQYLQTVAVLSCSGGKFEGKEKIANGNSLLDMEVHLGMIKTSVYARALTQAQTAS